MLDEKMIQTLEKMPWKDFEALLESVRGDDDAEKELIIHRAATDIELYATFFFPHYCQNEFNLYHHDLFKTFKWRERAIRRARGAPRGSAKSSFTTLIKPLHDLCYGLEKLIIIISSNEPLSTKKLKDIRDEITNNELLAEFYGLGFRTTKPGSTEFIADSSEGECMFVALGKGAEIRGIRFNEHRPTKIICDDVESPKEVPKESIRRKVEDWYFEDVTKAGNTTTNIDFVGTVLHRDSLLSNLLKNAAYDTKLYKSVISWSERQDLWEKWKEIYSNLEDEHRFENAQTFYVENEDEMLKGAKVLWPDREPYLYLMKELVEIGKRAFWKEKLNTPLGDEETVFNQEEFKYFRETPEGLYIEHSQTLYRWEQLKYCAYGVMDPSTGQSKPGKTKSGDFTVILTGFKDPRGRLLVYEDWTKKAPPTKFIQEVFEKHGRFEYQKFGVETNLFRNLLMPNLIEERKRREAASGQVIKLPFYDIEQTENKHARIFTIEPKVSNGWIIFNRALSEEFMSQLMDFPKAEHDDCPDALEMLWSLVNNKYKAAAVGVDGMAGR